MNLLRVFAQATYTCQAVPYRLLRGRYCKIRGTGLVAPVCSMEGDIICRQKDAHTVSLVNFIIMTAEYRMYSP